MSPAPKDPYDEDQILDLFVVGGGPHALAAISRLYEPTPSAIYSDVEHARLHWIRKHKKRTVSRDVEEGRAAPTTATAAGARQGNFRLEMGPKVVVMDKKKAGWLGVWETLFEAFGIKNLRSPLFFHPHPGDIDALKSYAHLHGRSDELTEIGGVVGKEWSKHQKRSARVRGVPPRQPHINLREASDYHTPSTALFGDFIREEVVERYGLEDVVQHGTVSSIRFLRPSFDTGGLPTPPSSPRAEDTEYNEEDVDEPLFLIRTADGRAFRSRAVIMAIGPGGIPNVPAQLRAPEARTVVDGPGWCHTAAFLQPGFSFPPKHERLLQERLVAKQQPTVLIIGGGLTSAQIADLVIKKGCKAILLCRSHTKVKPFDIGHEWMGKFSNLLKMVYFQEDDPTARLEQFRAARGGGSLTVPYHKIVKAHVVAGVLELRTLSSITQATWDAEGGAWEVAVERRCEKKSTRLPRSKRERKSSVDAAGSDAEDDAACGACPHPEIEVKSDVLHADYIISATGSLYDVEGLPFLQDLHKTHPIKSAGGMPVLTEDLGWQASVPLFVMGGYAGLHVGPGAPNLIGARDAAERVANGLGAAFPDVWGEDADWRAAIQEGGKGDDDWRRERWGHLGSQYDVLEVE